jgi:prepilin-type N-terminal cleavage/methylation domain-containing protein/prepilin-type processing-associated H-X9-DG protein
MKGRKGFTLIELLVVIAIIAILAAILFPVFARARRTAQTSTCQSNMKQIGNGIKMHISDWEDTFPTNRRASGENPPLSYEVPLSINTSDGTYGKKYDPKINPNTGKPIRFVGYSAGSSITPINSAGPNWVEGLYNYVETVTSINDPSSIWKCPSAVTRGRNDVNYSCVSYAFNFNLVEQAEGAIKSSANLLMLRELDGYMYATMRPSNRSVDTANENTPPTNALLAPKGSNDDGYSIKSPAVNYRLHGTGSNILFADGHVKLVTVSEMLGNYYRSTQPNDTYGIWYESDKMRIAITPN